MAIYQSQIFKTFLLQNCKNLGLENFAFYGTTVEPIKLQTHCAPQNDHLNLIFEKNVYVVHKKITRNGRKMVVFKVTIRLGESNFT